MIYILGTAAVVAFVTITIGFLSWIIRVERDARAERRAEKDWKALMLRQTRDAIQQYAHRIAAGDAGRVIERNYQQLIRIQRAQLKDLDG